MTIYEIIAVVISSLSLLASIVFGIITIKKSNKANDIAKEAMKKCGNRLICVYVCSKKYLKKWQIHLVIIILIMMKTLQNIWKHKREFQINIFMVIGIDKFQFVELTLN